MLIMRVMRTLWVLADVDLGLARAADAPFGLAGVDLGLDSAAHGHDARDAHSLGPR